MPPEASTGRCARSQAVRAFQPNYLPLEVGNSWTLASQGRLGDDVRTIRVTGREKIGDVIYFRVEGLEQAPALLRRNAVGQIVERTEDGEALWYDFVAPVSAALGAPSASWDAWVKLRSLHAANPSRRLSGRFPGHWWSSAGPRIVPTQDFPAKRSPLALA